MRGRKAGGRSRKRGRASWRGRLLKLGIAAAGLVMLVAAAFLIRYYYAFNGMIDRKLLRQDRFAQTEIFAAPVKLEPGRRLNRPQLLRLLGRLGYAERQATPSGDISYFESAPDRLIVHNGADTPVDAGRTVALAWSGQGLQSVVDTRSRREIDSFSLKPELLSNIIGKSREKRRYVAYGEIPKVLVNAVLAGEDRRFFSHSGVDPFRIFGALLVDLRKGDKVQGASTLTQQFVKQYFLTPERTWSRKIADAYLSILLEKRLSKEQIFELYCNEVYLGQRASFSILGVGEASESYFDKRVKDLTLGEAALLAGIIPAPNRLSPLRYPDRARARRDLILGQMAEFGMITGSELAEEKSKPLDVKPAAIQNYNDAPYFVDYVQDVLVDRLGDVDLSRTKHRVFTTLNTDLQQAAYESLREGVVGLDARFARGKSGISPGTVQASLIAVDPRSGSILAMIGGRSYGQSQYNRITQAKRQPGSIFKPLVYAAALETAYTSKTPLTAVSTVLDEPTQFPFQDLVYEPRNYKDEYHGQVTMRQAVSKSLNIAAIKFAEKTGYDNILSLARRLRLNAQIKAYPAMALGAFEVTPLEMVRAYTAFANNGLLAELTPLLKIMDGQSRTVYEPIPRSEPALRPQIAFMITSLLESVLNSGTGAGVRARGFSLPAAGKTGTSRDGWFAGYTPELLCIVWVGFDDNRELNLSGSQAALPIWAEFMKKCTTRLPLKGEGFPVPEGISSLEIDPTTGLLATPRCLERIEEHFIQGSEPAIACYGNSYEQMLDGGPANIFAAPGKENPGVRENKGNSAAPERRPTKDLER